jgi:hypothetical protein
MKKWVFVILLLFGLTSVMSAQSYSKKEINKDFGKFDREISSNDKISISSYITKQEILPSPNFQQKQAVLDMPKYRYELVLQSNSIYNGNLTKTWIYGARVFIDSLEVTRGQSPDGFTAIINIEPTTIFRYDSSLDTINIKITWKSSIYYRDK